MSFTSLQFSSVIQMLGLPLLFTYLTLSKQLRRQIFMQGRILDVARGVGEGGASLPIFCNHLFFCNHFEELQTVLFEVELIINNALLTYAYSNTTETCYTQSFVILQAVIKFF